MELETGTIEVVENTGLPSEEVVDLTCEGSEPVVVDLTSNDSVEVLIIVVFSPPPPYLLAKIVDEGPGRRRSGGSESYVLSSDEEGSTEREVYVSTNIARPAFVPPVVNSSCSRFFKVDGSLYQQNVGTCSAASVFVTHSNMPILARLAEKNSPTNSTTPFTFSSVFLGSFHVQ
ncbi:UNVERIFIED_CONTAM: hypothetical protein FKN15_047731 [Acipenser sinensis]